MTCVGVWWLALASSSMAAFVGEDASTWGNQMATPNENTAYSFNLSELPDFYYERADALGLRADGWIDVYSGANKYFLTKFEFSQPIRTFSFVTPNLVNVIAEVTWQYSLDNVDYTVLWQKGGTGLANYAPEATAVYDFGPASTVTRLYLVHSTTLQYCGEAFFYPGAGQLNVTTVPEPMTLGLLAMGAVSFLRRRV
jgi:hypothetical protein